eukprot:2531928-Prymnesium_polylepis.1
MADAHITASINARSSTQKAAFRHLRTVPLISYIYTAVPRPGGGEGRSLADAGWRERVNKRRHRWAGGLLPPPYTTLAR